jgi:hypothetical protein
MVSCSVHKVPTIQPTFVEYHVPTQSIEVYIHTCTKLFSLTQPTITHKWQYAQYWFGNDCITQVLYYHYDD